MDNIKNDHYYINKVHDYGNVDLSIVFDTLKDDIPELLILLDEELS